MDRISLLATQMDAGYRSIRGRAEGLTDDEFWWEPAADCWTVRRRPDGRWAADYEAPDPDPSPMATIAWRLVHVAESKVMYHEYAFGPGHLTFPDIDSAHTPEAALDQLDKGHRLLADDLQTPSAGDLEQPVKTNWGEEWPTWKIFWTMIEHDLHHGAEIGALRDLYRVTHGAAAARPVS